MYERRNISKGEQAMAVAWLYREPEKGGRGKKTNSSETKGFSAARLSQARQVLRQPGYIYLAGREAFVGIVLDLLQRLAEEGAMKWMTTLVHRLA